MVENQDTWRKKSRSGIVRENPLSSAQSRVANPLSLARPHASATPTQTRPKPSVPERSPAVSLRRGDTLWEVAQKQLGNGNRWRELRKADGSQFTEKETRRLTVGTQVHLPNKTTAPTLRSNILRTSTQSLSTEAIRRREYPNSSSYQAKSTGSRDSSNTWNNNSLINGTVKGIALGTPTENKSIRPTPKTKLDTNRAIGRITERAWNEHFNSRSDIVRNIRQTTWKDRSTKKTLPFSDAKSRRPDNFIKLNNGRGVAVEIKGTPLAAESSEASKQRARDRTALSKRALLGNKNKGFHEVHSATTKVGLPVLGSGGNTALPGKTQKHVIINPRSGAQPLPSTWNERVKLLGGYKDSTTYIGTRGANASGQTRKLIAPKVSSQSKTVSKIPQVAKVLGESKAASVVLRGASKVAAPVAIALDTWRLGDAYKKDGFGKEFRKTAGSVAGGWGGAAAGAAGGAAIGSVVPVVGTAAGAVVGGVIGGIAGSEFGDDIEQGAEKVGKGIVDGGKKVWNKLFG